MRITTIIDHDLAPAFVHVCGGGTVVCPTAGLGPGLRELPSRAPCVFAYIRHSIIRLKRLGTPAGISAIPHVLNLRDIRGPFVTAPPNVAIATCYGASRTRISSAPDDGQFPTPTSIPRAVSS